MGLDVPVQDLVAVRRLHRAADLDADPQHFGDGEMLAAGPDAEVRLGAVLHDQVGTPVAGDRGVEDLHDVGVIGQPGHRVRFGGELTPGLVGQAGTADDLDRDVTARHLLLVQVHLGVAAGAEMTQETVAGKLGGGPVLVR